MNVRDCSERFARASRTPVLMEKGARFQPHVSKCNRVSDLYEKWIVQPNTRRVRIFKFDFCLIY